MKYLGQHFLKDKRVIKKMVKLISPKTGELIIELGAGHGELTFSIFKICKKKICRIIAIEKDPKLVKALEDKFGEHKNITILKEDIRNFLTSSQIQSLKTYKLVGNIPYYLTGYLLRLIGQLKKKPIFCVFLIQKEVALRLTAGPPKMNKLAAYVGFWGKVKICGYVNKEKFRPKPKVDSAIVKIRPALQSSNINWEDYCKTVELIFKYPRKTIINNLKADINFGSISDIETSMLEKKIARNMRPGELSLFDIIKLAGLLKNFFQKAS